MTITCEWCGASFTRTHPGGTPPRYCSRACGKKVRRAEGKRLAVPNVFTTCEGCGIEFSTYRAPSSLPVRFCSVRCTGDARKGENNPHWKGGRFTSREGYVFSYVPTHPAAVRGYVQEHRLVMEQKIGRFLVAEEVVHHRNHIRDDNRPENLQLLESNSAHRALHAMEQRVEILSWIYEVAL